MGTRTKGSGATGLQNGWFWRRAGSRARRSAGKSQKEGLEDQGVLKCFKGRAVDLLVLPGPPGFLSGSFLGSQEFFSGIYC
jgi:hypothetical protein